MWSLLRHSSFVILTCLSLNVSTTLHSNQQTGVSNYDIDLEDVVILALFDDSDYDYSYDYSDLTVKPEQDGSSTTTPTIIESSSSTENSPIVDVSSTSATADKSTETPVTSSNTTVVVLASENSSAVITHEHNQNSTHPSKPMIMPEHPLNTHNYQIPVVVVTETTKLKKGYVSSSSLRKKPGNSDGVDSESLPKRTCSPGFFLDDKNRCKKVINRRTAATTKNPKPPLPYGLRYAQRPTLIPTDQPAAKTA